MCQYSITTHHLHYKRNLGEQYQYPHTRLLVYYDGQVVHLVVYYRWSDGSEIDYINWDEGNPLPPEENRYNAYIPRGMLGKVLQDYFYL